MKAVGLSLWCGDGGLASTVTFSEQLTSAIHADEAAWNQPKLHCNHGRSRSNPGHVSTSTTQDHLWARWYWWRLVHIPSGLKHTYVTPRSTSTISINKLRMMFSTHGIPDTILSDNASAFVGQEFQNCCRVTGIQHITMSPHHPSSNGHAERAAGFVKEGVKRMDGGDLETKLACFLLDYRFTPHSTTGIAPSELLMHRHLKTRLQLIKPDIGGKV